MFKKPWSAVGNPTSALGLSGSSFGPSSLAPIGINYLLLSNLTTGVTIRVGLVVAVTYWPLVLMMPFIFYVLNADSGR